MSQLTDLLTQLDKAATPGPWTSDEHGGNFYVWAPDGMVADNETEGGFVPPEVVTRMRGTGRGATDTEKAANAALIVALRNNLPEILLALEAAEKAEELTAQVREAQVVMQQFAHIYPDGFPGDWKPQPEHLASQVTFLCNRQRVGFQEWLAELEKTKVLTSAVAEASAAYNELAEQKDALERRLSETERKHKTAEAFISHLSVQHALDYELYCSLKEPER